MYCDVNDIVASVEERRLIDLTNETGNAEQYDTALISEFIERSERIIDSYLFGQYHLPITDANDLSLLMPMCVSITLYELYSRKLLEIPELIYQRYRDAISDLEKIRKGVLRLFSAVAGDNPKSTNKYLVTDITPSFIDNSLEGY